VDETVLEGQHPEDYPAHRLILGVGGIIVENLTNLEAVDFPDPFLSLLPVKLGGSDGAPVRAVALSMTT
jgi:kynurenine formamidase